VREISFPEDDDVAGIVIDKRLPQWRDAAAHPISSGELPSEAGKARSRCNFGRHL
jgi:hypothetical protein